jgi:hypothetical protein
MGSIATCATPDLLLQHPDETLATYVQNTRKTRVLPLQNIYNIQMKQLKHTFEANENT